MHGLGVLLSELIVPRGAIACVRSPLSAYTRVIYVCPTCSHVFAIMAQASLW